MTLDATHAKTTVRATPEAVAPAMRPAVHRMAGLASMAVAVACCSLWIGWWALTVGPGPLPIALVALEAAGLLAGVGVGIALLRARRPFEVALDGDRSFRYLDVIAAGHGVHQARAVRRQLQVAFRSVTRVRPTRSRDVARCGVMFEGPRRLAQLVMVAASLLLGTAPFPVPPVWALAMLTVGLAAMSLSHHLLSDGAIMPGDRIRWSFASMGEVFGDSGTHDRDLVAPRRWIGVVGAAVALCLTIALRGVSDRWTHGLPEMATGERVALMTLAISLVVGALVTIGTMAEPQLRDAHLVARRHEERTARQSVLAGAVCVGVIGFLAGVLPGHVDAAERDVPGVEQILDRDPVGVIGRHAVR